MYLPGSEDTRTLTKRVYYRRERQTTGGVGRFVEGRRWDRVLRGPPLFLSVHDETTYKEVRRPTEGPLSMVNSDCVCGKWWSAKRLSVVRTVTSEPFTRNRGPRSTNLSLEPRVLDWFPDPFPTPQDETDVNQLFPESKCTRERDKEIVQPPAPVDIGNVRTSTGRTLDL